MLFLNSADIVKALPMNEAIETARQAFLAISADCAETPQRLRVPLPRTGGESLIMPSRVTVHDRDFLSVKVLTTFTGCGDGSRQGDSGAVLVLDADSGEAVGLVEGVSFTAIRTGAASGVATDALARDDCRTACLLGAGAQGYCQVEAILAVRPIESFRIYDIVSDRAESLVRRMQREERQPSCTFQTAGSVSEALDGADVVCTSTNSADPVFEPRELLGGAHINAIGSSHPARREIPSATIRSSLVVVDSLQAALAEAGDIRIPLERGLMAIDSLGGELGKVLEGRCPGRTGDDQTTVFKSVGVAAQDTLAAAHAVKNAFALGLGTSLAWP